MIDARSLLRTTDKFRQLTVARRGSHINLFPGLRVYLEDWDGDAMSVALRVMTLHGVDQEVEAAQENTILEAGLDSFRLISGQFVQVEGLGRVPAWLWECQYGIRFDNLWMILWILEFYEKIQSANCLVESY